MIDLRVNDCFLHKSVMNIDYDEYMVCRIVNFDKNNVFYRYVYPHQDVFSIVMPRAQFEQEYGRDIVNARAG